MFIKEKHNDINKNEKRKKINLCTLNVEEYTKGLRFPATKNDGAVLDNTKKCYKGKHEKESIK